MVFNFNFTIEADPERPIIRSKIYGIWKKDTAEEYHKEYKIVAQPILGAKWAKLTNLFNWKPSYPEINKVIGEHIRWCHENNAVFSVYVVDNPVTRDQLKKMIAHSELPEETRIFKTIDEGEIFLKDRGF